MTVSQPTPAGAVLVAIDIAKHRHEILLELPGRRRWRCLAVLNTRPEHDRLVAFLQGLEAPVVVGFEATGNYRRPLAHRLLGEGFELRPVSSLALARKREALSDGWDKNDPKDAQAILHMLRIGACHPPHHKPPRHPSLFRFRNSRFAGFRSLMRWILSLLCCAGTSPANPLESRAHPAQNPVAQAKNRVNSLYIPVEQGKPARSTVRSRLRAPPRRPSVILDRPPSSRPRGMSAPPPALPPVSRFCVELR